MNVAIMQPYFLPYIGYFQLIAAVDRFVIYDTVQYTKKGWINRNRLLRDGAPAPFTLPLEKASDYAEVRARRLAPDFRPARLRAQIADAYRPAPHHAATMALVDAILAHEGADLFGYLHNALALTCAHLGIATPIRVASEVEGATALRGQARVLDICARLSATTYVNPPGGMALYEPAAFAAQGVALRFLKPRPIAYAQFGTPFVPWLSILDVMMFNPPSAVREMLCTGYDLVAGE